MVPVVPKLAFLEERPEYESGNELLYRHRASESPAHLLIAIAPAMFVDLLVHPVNEIARAIFLALRPVNRLLSVTFL